MKYFFDRMLGVFEISLGTEIYFLLEVSVVQEMVLVQSLNRPAKV